MACQVKECDNILCDTYVSDVGYICNQCQTRFKESYTGTPDEDSHPFIAKLHFADFGDHYVLISWREITKEEYDLYTVLIRSGKIKRNTTWSRVAV